MSSQLAAVEPKTREIASQKVQEHVWTPEEKLCLGALARGVRRSDLAHRLVGVWYPHIEPRAKALKYTRIRILKLSEKEWFRDALWAKTQVVTDLATPGIMQGVVHKAMRGDVPAAKFALEIAGRYTPKGDPGPAQVNVVIGGLPRPGYDIEGEATEE